MMQIGVLGANFKSCKLHVREAVALSCQRQLSFFSKEAKEFYCVVLSTCNRIEIYFSAEDLAFAQSEILHLLQKEIAIPFEHHLYSYFGVDCFRHLVKVTAGLDSAIIAETDIQRQVKVAYEKVASEYELPSCIHYLFQKSLRLGKYIRSHFSLSGNGVTLPKLLFDRGGKIFADLKDTSILFLGNSQINQQVISFFKYKGCKQLSICSRTSQRAYEFALREEIAYLPWERREEWSCYDWVIVGASAPGYMIDKAVGDMCTRCICDLSIPRTVDPQLVEQGVSLYNIEDLICDAEGQQKTSREVLALVEAIVVDRVDFYHHAFLNKGSYHRLCV